MPPANDRMSRLGELLDQALPLGLNERRAWFDALTGEDRQLMQGLRDSLLAEDPSMMIGGPLDQPPRIGDAHAAGAIARQTGERFGAYELLRPLGAGGMAEVWLARRADGAFEREVALKIPRLRGMPAEMAGRFARECRILASLEFPGIARLYDAGVDANGVPYIAMEFVKGEPLVEWCNARKLDPTARLGLFLQVLDAVSYAHQRHVLHRDLKPSNILVTEQGEARLLDFGVARLLQGDAGGPGARHAWGSALTPGYASPELLRGEVLDLRSDVYSLGVLLHELLTGSRPPPRWQADIGSGLPHPMREVLLKALALLPAERYADTASLAAALRPLAGVATAPARGAGRARYLAAAVAGLVLLGALFWQSRNAVSTARFANNAVSVAVLLPAIAGEPARAYRDYGLAAALLTHLTDISGLRATGVDSAYGSTAANEGPGEVARRLGVRYLLQSRIASDGGTVRVDVQLVDGKGNVLLERSYARPVQDGILTALNEMALDGIAVDAARAVATRLDVGMLALDQGGTNNPDAADRYWRYREYMLQDYPAGTDLRGVASGLLEAVAMDPQFAMAWDGLEETFGMLADRARNAAKRLESKAPAARVGTEISLLETRIQRLRADAGWYGARSRWARRRVEQVAPDGWLVLKNRVYAALLQENWEQAESLARQLYNSPPRTLEKIKPLGDVLFTVGRIQEAIDLEDIELQLGRQAMWISRNQQYNLYAAGKFEEGEEEFKHSLKLPGARSDPAFLAFVRLLGRANADPAELRARFPPSWLSPDAQQRPFKLEIYAAIGDPQAMRSTLRRGFDNGQQLNHIMVDAAGDGDLALRVFLKDWDKRRNRDLSGAYWHLWLMPHSEVRTDPRFKNLIRKIGLDDYWRKHNMWADFCRPLGADDFECLRTSVRGTQGTAP